MLENDALPVFDMAAMNPLKINTSVRIMPMRCLWGLNLIYVTDALSHGYDGNMFMGVLMVMITVPLCKWK
ncbi:MAG: hypothetical protein CM1200mP30_14680 [Pseudomonadota bacterium]|nr:MAG: hypothetical protein CM1200mP30_14680 [Pseudomonadota bacterium]